MKEKLSNYDLDLIQMARKEGYKINTQLRIFVFYQSPGIAKTRKLKINCEKVILELEKHVDKRRRNTFRSISVAPKTIFQPPCKNTAFIGSDNSEKF